MTSEDQNRIFLCHATEDKPKVVKIYNRLKREGFKPWVDKKDLLPGQNWDREIRNAIKSSRFIIIFFSLASVTKRGYVQREFKLALETMEEMPEGMDLIIPVRLDKCIVPERFRDIQYCDLFARGSLQKVLEVLRSGIEGKSDKITNGTYNFLITKGHTFYYQENYEEAITFYDQAISVDPDDPEAFNAKGASLIKLGNMSHPEFWVDYDKKGLLCKFE